MVGEHRDGSRLAPKARVPGPSPGARHDCWLREAERVYAGHRVLWAPGDEGSHPGSPTCGPAEAAALVSVP